MLLAVVRLVLCATPSGPVCVCLSLGDLLSLAQVTQTYHLLLSRSK